MAETNSTPVTKDDGLDVEFGTLADQKDETYFDDRSDADNDLEKGRIHFPQGKLYGRDKEVLHLLEVFNGFTTYSNNPSRRVVFLAGYSGTGKSALMEEFIQQAKKDKDKHPIFLSGKFGQMKAGDPFAAIAQAVNAHIAKLVHRVDDKDQNKRELKSLRNRLAKNDISFQSQDAQVLVDTLIPDLGTFLESNSPSDNTRVEEHKSSAISYEINVIKYAFVNFMKALATKEQPLIFFVDDLQWADDASLQLLKALLTDKSLQYLMFVGAYRINEINDSFQTTKDAIMNSFETSWPPLKHEMEITNLSPDAIGEFISHCLQRDTAEIGAITDAVYTRTLGNIFFVRQALEELVRKNAIYYDVVTFRWQFGDITRVELEECLSDDVVEMVQSKLKTLPKDLQIALSAAAFTKHAFDAHLLTALLESVGVHASDSAITKLLQKAMQEGLVLPDASAVKMEGFKFAHDRIREAACASIATGLKRDRFLFKISHKLLGLEPSEEWMLFTAAHHLNSIPHEMTDSIQVAELNLRVGRLAVAKGSFSDAVIFFRSGTGRLDSKRAWLNQYDLALDLYNNLAECEHTLGDEERTTKAVQQVFDHAKTLSDKIRSQYVYVYSKCGGSNQGYKESVKAGLEILKLYGIDVPEAPTEKEVNREKLQFKVALRGRNLMCLAKFPITKDPMLLGPTRVAQITLRHAVLSQMMDLASLLAYRMLRLALNKKYISNSTSFIIMTIGGPLRRVEKYEKVMSFTNAGIAVMDRFPGDVSNDFTMSKIMMYATLIPLRKSFRDLIEDYFGLHKTLMTIGNTDPALGAGMHAMLAFLIASLPLGSLFEPKLILFEELALNLGKKTFHVIFALIRQCLYNLTGGIKASTSPTVLDGPAFNELEVMGAFQGPARKMNNRDIATLRLMLAVIFDDIETMDQLLDRLDEYPIFDSPMSRQHIRMTYCGLAAHILCLDSGKHRKWAENSLQFFEKLAKFGSPNAQPVYECLKALAKPTEASFQKAIDTVSDLGMLNMSGLMNERCGIWLMKQPNSKDQHTDYLKCAIWCYHDWGAMAKVNQMKERYPILVNAIQKKPPSQMSSVRRQTALLGIPRPAPLSGTTESST